VRSDPRTPTLLAAPILRTVLIIEDQADIRQLIRLTLEDQPLALHEADNGGAGWDAAQALRPDIVLLDVTMPGALNGVDVCRLIKADPRTRHAAVIMLTARSQLADRKAAIAAGANAYLVKPFSGKGLVKAVHSVTGDSDAMG